MQISMKMEIKQVSRYISRVHKRQIPFAASQALNDSAFKAREKVMQAMSASLDRPTPWTKKGVIYKRSNKNNLTASVSITPERWKYLKYQVEGGSRQPAKKAIPVPVAMRRNKYGNMAKGGLQNLINSPKTFVGQIDGVGGVWDRKTGRLLVAFVSEATYEKKLAYHAIVRAAVRKNFKRDFDRRLAAAIRSAR